MPPNRATLTENLEKGRAIKAEKQAQSAKLCITELELEVIQKSSECKQLQVELDKSNKKCSQLAADLSMWESKHKDTYHKLCMQRQTTKRGQDKVAQLTEQIAILKNAETNDSAHLLKDSKDAEKAIALLMEANEDLQGELSDSMTQWSSQLHKTWSKLEKSQSNCKALQKKITALQKHSASIKAVKEHAIASVRENLLKKKSVHHLMDKGVFTEETRNVVHLLVKAGCSHKYINQVIFAVLHSAGIETIGTISHPSIACILHEGYFTAKIQLGYEMKNTKSMTFSADGTSHRSINYTLQHVNLLVEDYTSSDSDTLKCATCFFGIQSTCDGSSEEAMKNWDKNLKDVIDLYNESPFGKRQGSLLKFVDLLIKLMGIHSDHCAKKKKDARLLEELKAWAVDQSLGEEAMLEMSLQDIDAMFKRAEAEMIKSVGSQRKWDALSDGGYLAIMGWWKENGLEGPVLLANRDNNPVVQEQIAAIEQGDIPTSAQVGAFNQSTRGAIKMAEIAGAIFNHKDDKKGHHDIFRYWWWEHVGTPFTFPDTSNNRFQSYCDAAGALILYSQQFIDFLHNLRINKTNSQLNHMEQNLMNALQCDSTKTELAVLAIYAEAISYPYMKAIHTSHDTDQNMLDLGPLHHHVYEHMQKIISNPDILLGNDVSCSSATLDGEEWQNPAVVKKIHELSPTLPHLRDLLLVFFKGAAETWEHFTSEFAPGGLIDEATTEEKELAWMPATNDVNEGALGSFRHLMRYQPQLTLLNHNALAMFFRNNTQAEKTAQKEKREQKAKETADQIAATGIILDKVKALALKGTLLKDQLKVFKNAGAPNLMTAKLPTKALSDAIDLYEDGKWLLESDTEEGSDDSEEEDESGWEDDN
ncbi:hypothetical protein BYT27DRAFT_7213745 [Phlegmacium glaucopus]|nr:hypothetical protein BYT27DRAFT_7213745 [Phlegmacium glaucopus]